MLSAHLLLVCVAVATAVPLPYKHYTTTTAAPATSTAAPARSSRLIDVDSKLTSNVITGGGAVVQTSGSTSGAGSVTRVVSGPGLVFRTTAVGSGGVSGQSASSGDGLAAQLSRARTVVVDTEDGTKVQTGTEGKGTTLGTAAAAQKTGANGGVNTLKAIKFVETDGKNLFQVEQVQRAAAKSASGHEASSEGLGSFNVLNLGSTEIKHSDFPSLPPPAGPAPTKKPKHWKPTAAPTTTTEAPTTASPKFGISTNSKLKQAGKTTGSGAISSTGATQGSASSKSGLKTRAGGAKQSAVANSGVTGAGVSSGDGAYKQGAEGKTVVAATKEGVKVTTGSTGFGFTDGTAGTLQNVAANGGFTGLSTLNIKLPTGKHLVNIQGIQKAAGTSSTGHKASSTGPGKFATTNIAGTDIQLKTPDISLVAPLIPTPAPTTTAAPSTAAPKLKFHKW
nr:CP19k-like protein 4 [Tetraclita japonica formosana]